MKLNATPRHYMPLSQNQSDDDESGPGKEDKNDKLIFKNSFNSSEGLAKDVISSEVEVDAKSLPMSPLRILMFILSLFLCILFVVVFVFFLPCIPADMTDTCHLTYKWKSILRNMSYTSALDFVNNSILGRNLVIFGYINDEYGMAAVDGSTGKEQWRLPLHSTPLSSLCNHIDANSDGIPECLVFGSNGLFTAVDVKKGIPLWYLHNHSDLNEPNAVYGPLIMPDCDNDGIEDVLVSYNINSNENGIYLALVSGGTGQIIGSLVGVPMCTGPITARFSWTSQNVTDFIFFCTGEKNGNLWQLSAKSVCETALNETDKLLAKNIFRVPHFVKDAQFYKVSCSENHLVIVLDGIRFMLLEWSQFSFQIMWKIYFKAVEDVRILLDGQFIEGSNQLIVSSVDANNSKIAGLSVSDGKELWSITQDNGVVSSVMKLPKFYGNADGLILKTVSPVLYKNISKISKVNIDVKMDEKLSLKNGLGLFEEKYILIKCGKILGIKTINSEEVWSYCEGSICQPNIYTRNITAIVRSESNRSFGVITITSTLLANTSREEVTIKYLNLKKNLAFTKCNR